MICFLLLLFHTFRFRLRLRHPRTAQPAQVNSPREIFSLLTESEEEWLLEELSSYLLVYLFVHLPGPKQGTVMRLLSDISRGQKVPKFMREKSFYLAKGTGK